MCAKRGRTATKMSKSRRDHDFPGMGTVLNFSFAGITNRVVPRVVLRTRPNHFVSAPRQLRRRALFQPRFGASTICERRIDAAHCPPRPVASVHWLRSSEILIRQIAQRRFLIDSSDQYLNQLVCVAFRKLTLAIWTQWIV
jgi:hypothetical protein